MVVFGTRPEAVKLAPVTAGLLAEPKVFRTTVVVTGQHREMLDQTLAAIGLEPDVDLNLMRRGQSPSDTLASSLAGLDRVLARLRPDGVLVQGDTTTALAGALAAFHRKLPVGHVEAGLRTHDFATPFPEEANRRLIATLTTWHFAPTAGAAANLRAEGVPAANIFVTGNPVVDALQVMSQAALNPDERGFALRAGERRRVLVTAHRRESFGRPLKAIVAAMGGLARRFPDTQFIFPVHPNPEVRRAVRQGLRWRPANLRLLAPLPYDRFVALLGRTALVVTDSGGVQEEAAALHVPSVILRRVTERPEVLTAGGRLVKPERPAIVAAVAQALNRKGPAKLWVCPFGDGRAAERITAALAWAYGRREKRPADFHPAAKRGKKV